MKTNELLRLAAESSLDPSDPRVKQLARSSFALGATKERDACASLYMQLFLDPENQPTQFGTATKEYREQELKEAKTLLKELAHIVRTTHLYGPEMKKILEKEEVLNGKTDSSL